MCRRRAKFITGSVAALLQKPGGGVSWLHGLRNVPYEEAAAELSALPGVGPKVGCSNMSVPYMANS